MQETGEDKQIRWEDRGKDPQAEEDEVRSRHKQYPTLLQYCSFSFAVLVTLYAFYSTFPSSIGFSLTKWTTASIDRQSEFSRIILAEGHNFERIAEEHLSLSEELRGVEMVMMDSLVLMASSELEAKEVIVALLSNVTVDARDASRRLQKLTSRIGGAVDSVTAIKAYTLKSFEIAEGPHLLTTLTSIVPWVPTQNPLTTAFEAAMSIFTRYIEHLVPEIDANDKHLLKMEEDLLLLQELIFYEYSCIVNTKSDMLGDFWTRMGGNGKELRRLDHHLKLLTNLEATREQTAVHVAAVSRSLKEMKRDMEGNRLAMQEWLISLDSHRGQW